MKNLFQYLLAIIFFINATQSFADNNFNHKETIIQDIESLLMGTSKESQISSTAKGIYVESKFCDKESPSLTNLLKDQLKIKQEYALTHLFEQILCAPTDDELNINLSTFSKNLAVSIPYNLVLYSGLQELGTWSLENAQNLSIMPATEAQINMLGIHTSSSSSSVTFWQTLSGTHIRIWYGRFKMAPSDTLIYEFKFLNNEWKLTQLWMGSRI